MILVGYDGSEDARAAIGRTAALFGGQTAVILTVWQPFAHVIAHTGVGFGMPPVDSVTIDKASLRRAEQIAHEGADLANEAGLEAEARVSTQAVTTARTILGEAEQLGAQVIVIGSRGLAGLKSLLLGSVSHEVIQHADRPVVVVPSPAVAASRRAKVQEDAVAVQ